MEVRLVASLGSLLVARKVVPSVLSKVHSMAVSKVVWTEF